MEKNNTNFPEKISDYILNLREKYDSSTEYKFLKYYQFVAKEAIKILPGRGLLIYHKMGLGKTMLAIAIADEMKSDREVVFLLAKSLQKNIVDEIKNYGIMKGDEKFNININFVSMDAYNSALQLFSLTRGKNLDGKLLIVDEAHNFFRSIINSQGDNSNARKIYNIIQNSKNLKIIFLSGTPITKNPFEMVPCCNLLAEHDILPTDYETFEDLYMDTEHEIVKNKEFLQNRLFGLVSYSEIQDENKIYYPEELPLKIEKIEMSEEQKKYYEIVYQRESTKFSTAKKRKPKTINLSLPRSSGAALYFVNSRITTNYLFPANCDKLSLETIPPKYLDEKHSKKIFKLMENIKSSTGKILIYSQFVNYGGIGIVSEYLKKNGYTRWSPKSPDVLISHAIISGEVDPEERSIIQDRFNSPDNNRGEKIKILLISKTGTEGLNLSCIREVHILEPYWDKSRIQQIISRAIRLNSHEALMPEEKNVQPFIYIGSSIDEIFYNRAEKMYKTIQEFLNVYKSVSIDCSINKPAGIECYLCAPNNRKLFSDNPSDDIKMENPCSKIVEYQVQAKKIITDDGTVIFLHNGKHYKKSDIGDFYEEILL